MFGGSRNIFCVILILMNELRCSSSIIINESHVLFETNSTKFVNTNYQNRLLGASTTSFLTNDVGLSSWTEATSSPGWSARVGFAYAVFDNKMWVMGGFSTVANSYVWYSSDGVAWTEATATAAWGARFYIQSVAFNNKLWIFGKGGGLKRDVWSSSDGATWTLETGASGEIPRKYLSSTIRCGY